MLFNKSKEYKGRAIDNLEPPIINTPTITGSAGETTAEYVATFRSLVGETTASSSIIIETCPDTLNQTNYVTLSVNSVDPNAVAVRYYKKSGESFLFLKEQTALTGSGGIYAPVTDQGNTLTANASPPTTNTSGRPEWRSMLWNYGRYVQRPELQDMQILLQNQQKKVSDLTHKNGDITRNGKGRLGSNNVVTYSELDMYIDGQICTVPGGSVTLDGTGEERVGVLCTPTIVTSDDDTSIWNLDTPGDLQENNRGADRLVYEFEWVVDTTGRSDLFVVETFIDGSLKMVNETPDRSILEKTLADREYDVSGNYVIWPFETEVVDHATDDDKAILRIKRGKASVNGYRCQHDGVYDMEFDRARDTGFNNEGTSAAFTRTGGACVSENQNPFDVDGLKLLIQVGEGVDRTVTLSGSARTAAQVCTQINDTLNAIPTDPAYPLVTCTALVNGAIQIKAADGKSLTIKNITGSAYTVLGLTAGTYGTTGTRLYRINKQYVKDVSDISYLVDDVLQISHNSGTHKDFLINNVNKIYGASNIEAKAWDGVYDWQEGVHWFQDTEDTDYINFTGMTAPEPSGTYYVKVRYRKAGIKSQLVLAQAIAPISKGAVGSTDNLTLTGATVVRQDTQVAINGLSGNASNVVSIAWVNSAVDGTGTEYSGYTFNKNSTQLAHNASTLTWNSTANTQPSQNNTYYCKFYFWHVTTAGDVVTADSYASQGAYDLIESYGSYNLRDCLDFRTSGTLPRHGEDVAYEYNYYLSRMDKLILSDSTGFMILRGSPAVYPLLPDDTENTFTLKVISIPAYTYSTDDIVTKDVAPVRKTQASLDKMAKQIEEIQYREVVNSWESEVVASETAATVSGVFTDAFTGFNKLDLSFSKNGIYHTAAVDRENRLLRLPVDQDLKEIALDESEGSGTYNVKRIGNSLVLSYEPVVFQSQPYATRYINAALDFTYEDYTGQMQLNPSVDVFMDSEQLPNLRVDFDNNLQPLLDVANAQLANQINWGAWRVTGYRNWWWGGAADIAREGTYQQLLPGSTTVELGDRVVDLSLVGRMRTKDSNGDPFYIHVDCSGLMPLQDHSVTIANIPCDFTYDTSVSSPRGSVGQHSTSTGKTTVRTDVNGRLTGKFAMPEGITAGTAIVKVSHYSTPSSSWAYSTFSSAGLMQTNQNTVLGMTAPDIQTETVSQTSSYWTWLDPLAQSFLVKDEITYMSEIGLFFKKKSATQPISFQIREMTNGFPNANILTTATVEPSQITTSETSLVETRIELNQLLGYKPNVEYALVPVPGKNNTDYELWGAKVGEIDIASGARVGGPPHDGVLFHSPNSRTWIPIEQTYLKFNLYKCNFESSAQLVFSQIDNISASILVTLVREVLGPGTSAKWYYSLNNKATWIPYNPAIETDMDTLATVLDLMVSVGSLGGSYSLVEHIAGIAILKHKSSAISIFNNYDFSEDLNPPNKIVALVDAEIDSERTIAPMASVDDGEIWFEIKASPDYTPASQPNSTLFRYKYETPDVTTISVTSGSSASPIVISLAEDHLWTDNMLATITGVEGNTAANGTWLLQNVGDTSAELYDPDTGDPSTGNGAYTTGGQMTFAEFTEFRPRVDLATSNLVRSPKIGRAGFVIRAD